MDNMEKEIQKFKEGSEIEMYPASLKVTLKNVRNWKTPSHDSIHGFWWLKYTCIHNRLTLELSRSQEA